MVSDKKIFMGISHRVLQLYVKLSSAVVAILVGILKFRTQFWKRTTQESFQQSLVEIGSVVSEKKIFLISSPLFFYFELGGHLGWKSGSPDTILEGSHPRIISAKFGWDWLSSFRGEFFFLISSPLFSNLHNRSK